MSTESNSHSEQSREPHPSRQWMTVEQTARILSRTRNAIWLALNKGVLMGKKEGNRWLIPTLTIVRILYSHPRNRCHIWASEVSPKKFKILPNSTCPLADLKPLTYEDDLKTDCDAHLGEQLTPRDAAVRLQDHFVALARDLARRDPFLQDDLVQEMSLAVLEQTSNGNERWFSLCGYFAARSFLKRERMRGGICHSKLGQLAVEAQKITDETLVQALLDDGESVQTIEEVLGFKLQMDAAG